jgi:hypothetical protein
MRQRNLDYARQDRDFYPTPAWVTEALLRTVRLPKRIWEPCCGDGAMARVLESDGHHVVATDLVDRGYGEGGRDFLMESRLPDGVTAIVTNPPYGKLLLPKIVAHALELTRPVGGMVAMLFNAQRSMGVWKDEQQTTVSPGLRPGNQADRQDLLVPGCRWPARRIARWPEAQPARREPLLAGV